MLRYVLVHYVTFTLCYATFCNSILHFNEILHKSANLQMYSTCPSTLLDSVWQEGIQYNLHTVDEVLASKLSGIAAPQVQEVNAKNMWKFVHVKGKQNLTH
jgi:hypothetical protein